MAACPWCKAAMADLSAPCPRCGRKTEAEAALGPGGGDPGAVPDLDLPIRPAKAAAKPAPPPAAKPAAPKPAPPPTAHAHGAQDDPGAHNIEMEGDNDAAPLDLDLSTGPPLTGTPSAAKLAAAKPAGGHEGGDKSGSQGAGHGQGQNHGAAPSALDRRSTNNGGIDPYEARALADYGEAPSEIWKAPLYAYRVLRRRPELKKLADLKKREADRAQNGAEDALMRYAELIRPDAERMPVFAEALSGVRGAEVVVRERDAVLASEADTHKAKQSGHEARISEHDAQLANIQTEERQIAGELAEADTLAKRAEARMKRAEIEVRNALVQAGIDPDAPAGAGGTGGAGAAGRGSAL